MRPPTKYAISLKQAPYFCLYPGLLSVHGPQNLFVPVIRMSAMTVPVRFPKALGFFYSEKMIARFVRLYFTDGLLPPGDCSFICLSIPAAWLLSRGLKSGVFGTALLPRLATARICLFLFICEHDYIYQVDVRPISYEF